MNSGLLAEAEQRGIIVPTARTLAKYGLTPLEWVSLLAGQGWRCAVCLKQRALWNTDHEHVRGWARMPAERRKVYVRGVLCWHCNRHVVPSNLTSEEGQRVADYLAAYEARRDAAAP